MAVYNLIELAEMWTSIRIVKKYTEELIYEGTTFDIPENLRNYTIATIRVRDSTLVVFI